MNHEVTEYRESLKGKKILVVGMGRSGKAAAAGLHGLGADVSVQDINTADKVDPKFVTWLDREHIESYLGTEPERMGCFDIIVMSPGVSPELGFIVRAKEEGVEVIGEVEMAYRLSYGKFAAITGTNGKTTTTTLTGEIFAAAGRKTAVVGNIGNPVITEALESTEDEWLVTEASSFQLETTKEFRPVVSAILNLTPDHLNRHKTMEAYGAAKARVTVNQTEDDYLIINQDDPASLELLKYSKAKVIPFSRKEELEVGAYLDDDMLVIKDEQGLVHPICRRGDLKIIGDHNVENVLAAAAISYFAGIDVETISEAVVAFPGVEHRIEYCGTVDGVRYYNDSKGTNVDAAVIALKALKENVLLIAGGDGKAQDFTEFGTAMVGPVKALILLGRDADQIEKAARAAGMTEIYREKDMNDCVRRAAELAQEGDQVLLSPACASWDMYDSYEQRGRHFKECVGQLLK